MTQQKLLLIRKTIYFTPELLKALTLFQHSDESLSLTVSRLLTEAID